MCSIGKIQYRYIKSIVILLPQHLRAWIVENPLTDSMYSRLLKCGKADPDLMGNKVCSFNNFLRYFIHIVIKTDSDLFG